jgi:pSer/pThr/pTyr-binding forkhead associated (FHA) protein
MINNKAADSPIERMVSGMIPRLVAIEGPLSGQTFYVDGRVISMGRLASNDICLEDPCVSRSHCVIRTEGEYYIIEDLSSTNGTYVNGELVKASSLKEGSIIQVGASRFLFRLQIPEESIALGHNLGAAENSPAPLSHLEKSNLDCSDCAY